VDGDQATVAAATSAVDALEVSRLLEAMTILHLNARSTSEVRRGLGYELAAGGGQLLAALEAASLDHPNSAGRAHTAQETMDAPAIALLGLKGPLH
jgi:hypothetical protein